MTHDNINKPLLMRLATFAAVGIAIVLVIVKLIGYILTNSLALMSSLIDSVLDLITSIVNLWAVNQALVPADYDHRFGHGKAEPLAGLFQSILLLISAFYLIYEAIIRLGDPVEIISGNLGIMIIVLSIVFTLLLVSFQNYVVKRTESVAIKADSLHYSGDLILNIGVIATLILATYFELSFVDSFFALGVSLYLILNAFRIVKQSFYFLMDQELSDKDRDLIKYTTLKHPKVLDLHELRTRSSGHQTFIQMHIVLNPKLSLEEAHQIADEVEISLIKIYPNADIIIHQDPAGIDENHRPVGSYSV